MGVTKVNPLFEHLSGALAKPKKKDGHTCGEYVIATHRVAESTNPNCQRVYIRPADAYQRSTPVTAHESLIRSAFCAKNLYVSAKNEVILAYVIFLLYLCRQNACKALTNNNDHATISIP